jgi:ABC-type phosphate transport system substrate-binding protein
MARLEPTPSQRERHRLAVLGVLAFAGVCLALCELPARADTRSSEEFLVIVNRANPAREVSAELAAEAFLKKTTRWSNGENIRPVDLAPDSGIRRRFSASVLKRSVAAVRSYWQQRIFTGRDTPPPELDSEDAVVRYVSKYEGAIGYVASSTKVGDAKVLLLRAK